MKKRKKTTKKGLEQISRQNEMVFNTASEGIYGLDLNGNLTFINRATARMLGWDVEELISKRGHDVLHHSRLDGTPYPPEECPIYSSFKDGIVRFVDNEVFWRKDGTSFPVNYTSTPIWEDGKPIGAIVVFKDVTTEGALRENLAQLSKKNRYESIISTVTRSIHQSINLQEVLENTVEAMKQNIDSVDSVSIFLVEGQEAVLKAYSGLHPDWLVERVRKIPYPKGAIWNTIIEGKPIYCADVDQDTVIGPAGREAGIKSYLIIPIRYEGKTVGILNINSLKKNAFDEEELKLLESVAQQCQIAINKAKQAEALRKALQEVEQLKNQLQAENIYLQEEIKIEHNFEEIVGESESLKNVLRNVEKVAPTDTTVLIQGETGTGKELIARAIHNLSPRRERPLIKVNCGAIVLGLAESELFGHEKGAFTGAVQQRIGRFELAHGGTIFLDEVGELPLDIQVKLIRVLEEGEFERVGGSNTIKVDVRVIAATNRDLKKAVEEGKFRQDLYFRLNVFPILIPPLRERKEDIALLVRYFAQKYGRKLGKKIEVVPQEMMDVLLAYSWPGNVRELENMIERAVILSQGSILQIDESLDMRLDAELQTSGSNTLEDVERSHILSVLEETNWVIDGKRGAAAVLGINPATLRSRMKKLGIKRPGSSI
jgi:formate hydrogenlyase transcriptional activator